MDDGSEAIAIDLGRLRSLLVKAAVVVVSVGTAVSLVRVHVGWEEDPGDFGSRFELVTERSVPAWFTAALLAASGLVLALIALHRRRRGSGDWSRWAGLALLATVFSLDEVVSFHEYTSVVLGLEVLGFDGAYNWVVFGAAFVVLLAVAYAPFVAGLDPVLRNRLLLAAAIYFGGALGIEALNAHTASNGGDAGYRYALQTTVEESMEIGGALLLLFAALSLLADRGLRVVVRDAPPTPRSSAPTLDG